MHTAIPLPVPCKRAPWNKGRLIGQKRPLQPETQIPEFLSADRFSIGRADPAQSPRRIDSPCRYATSARALSSGNVQLPIGCCTIKNG